MSGPPVTACPCGLPSAYDACCGRLHAGTPAATAELLMRSRYAAFVIGNAAYLLATWHPTTRPRRLRLPEGRRWTGLQVFGCTGGGLLEPRGTVRFRARYVDGLAAGEQEEDSLFERESGLWRYVRAL